MRTLTVARDHISTLAVGDRVVRVDDYDLPGRPVVTVALGPVGTGSARAVRLVNDNGQGVNLYPDSGVAESVTIERDDAPAPVAARPRRRAVRHVGGVRLESDGAGSWWTTDRRFEIRFGYGGKSICETPHPVRLTRAMIEDARNAPGTRWAQPILFAAEHGRKGIYCGGGEEHPYDQWQAWDHQAGDYADGGQSCESFADAADCVYVAAA